MRILICEVYELLTCILSPGAITNSVLDTAKGLIPLGLRFNEPSVASFSGSDVGNSLSRDSGISPSKSGMFTEPSSNGGTTISSDGGSVSPAIGAKSSLSFCSCPIDFII
ncbi:hypothetical protein D3C76_1303140 [compost metagenome]